MYWKSTAAVAWITWETGTKQKHLQVKTLRFAADQELPATFRSFWSINMKNGTGWCVTRAGFIWINLVFKCLRRSNMFSIVTKEGQTTASQQQLQSYKHFERVHRIQTTAEEHWPWALRRTGRADQVSPPCLETQLVPGDGRRERRAQRRFTTLVSLEPRVAGGALTFGPEGPVTPGGPVKPLIPLWPWSPWKAATTVTHQQLVKRLQQR